MLYTKRGDDGTTKTFGSDQRISKSSAIAEALGAMDEINSFLGICKIKSAEKNFIFNGQNISDTVHGIQETLFIIQAELAGADKKVGEEKVLELEKLINEIETAMPPIKTFFISGGTELGATFDVARTMARRAERRVVGVSEEGQRPIGDNTKKYLNRLSSILYALARLSNHLSGIVETPPSYK
jgi:cob(I)alamin adenosyltransferase